MTARPEFELFHAAAVAPIHTSTVEQRRRWLIEAERNLFRLRSDQVMIDLLTDSGTGVMSNAQWAAMMRGDESYAGSTSYFRLQEVVRHITGIEHMLPVHQGRVAERLLVEAAIGRHPAGRGLVVPSNAHFDTTRCMIEASGAETVNLLGSSLGNIDLHQLDAFLHAHAQRVPFVMMTITCNSNGGQPVSLENLRAVREICDEFGKMLILDACRFAENAWFVKQGSGIRDRGSADYVVRGGGSPNHQVAKSHTIPSIVRAVFDLCDGVVMSARKDALCNVGGLLLLRDAQLYRRTCQLCVHTEGFQMTYGTLPGRDLEAMAVGLQEALDETYLTERIGAVQALAAALTRGGVRVIEPAGGHAVFIDAGHFCPHLARHEQPAHALACAIYEHVGVRCTRIGTVLKDSDGHSKEIVRLAVPRRRYSQAQMDYVAQAIIGLRSRAREIRGIGSSTSMVLPVEEPAVQAA